MQIIEDGINEKDPKCVCLGQVSSIGQAKNIVPLTPEKEPMNRDKTRTVVKKYGMKMKVRLNALIG